MNLEQKMRTILITEKRCEEEQEWIEFQQRQLALKRQLVAALHSSPTEEHSAKLYKAWKKDRKEALKEFEQN